MVKLLKKYPYHLLSKLYMDRTTSPGEELWFSLYEWLNHPGNGKFIDTIFERSLIADSRSQVGIILGKQAVTQMAVRVIMCATKALDISCPKGSGGSPLDHERPVSDEVRSYLLEFFGAQHTDLTIEMLANFAFRSAVETRAEMSDTDKREVTREVMERFGILQCYSCGLQNLRENGEGIAFDHIWPRSLGGVSTSSNILPVCKKCNGAKGDRVSWEVYGIVHDYTYARFGQDHDILLKMALHRLAAEKVSEQRNVTLKEAYLYLGPHQDIVHEEEREPKIFQFLSAHDKNQLNHLW